MEFGKVYFITTWCRSGFQGRSWTWDGIAKEGIRGLKEEEFYLGECICDFSIISEYDEAIDNSFNPHIKKSGRTRLLIFCSDPFPVLKVQEVDLDHGFQSYLMNYKCTQFTANKLLFHALTYLTLTQTL
jgi:hypothetical protein